MAATRMARHSRFGWTVTLLRKAFLLNQHSYAFSSYASAHALTATVITALADHITTQLAGVPEESGAHVAVPSTNLSFLQPTTPTAFSLAQ
jgi:hypothetical protein